MGHFTVMDGSEAEGDLVLIQTFFALLWKLFLKNTSQPKNNLIYTIRREVCIKTRSPSGSFPSTTVKWPTCMVFLLLDNYRMSLSGKLLIETDKLIKKNSDGYIRVF